MGVDKKEKKEYNKYIRLRELRNTDTVRSFSTDNNQKLKEKNNSRGVDVMLEMWYNNKGERFTDKKNSTVHEWTERGILWLTQ